MAISASPVELLRNFKPFGYLNLASPCVPSMSVSRRSASVNYSARSIAKCRCSMVGEIGENVKVTGKVEERDFTGTPYVPVYVILPPGTVNLECELVDPDDLINELRILKSVNVDGVVVDCWWGIVEAHPEQYHWSGYKELFQIVRKLNLKLQVVMSFHECGGNVGDDLHIPLPQWVIEFGRENPDIFFTDREGRRNRECLTWGVDRERIFSRRLGVLSRVGALDVYGRYMSSFRGEFAEFLEDGVISEIKIGLGPCGELRYPSYPAKHGWKYPGIGEFQCYDKYLMKSLEKTAQARGKPFWGRTPDNTGSYNSKPHETGFFCDKGDYDYSNYGRFFLDWYSQSLIDHANLVLRKAKQYLLPTPLGVKLPGIHWWHHTASHAAELTAGFYNHAKRDGYTRIGSLLREENNTALNFRCIELQEVDDQHEDFPETLANPENLFSEVRRAAWNGGIPFASENGRLHYDKQGYNKILENAKPSNDTLGGYLPSFTYLRLSPKILEGRNFVEFERFVRRMHGESVLDLDSSSHED